VDCGYGDSEKDQDDRSKRLECDHPHGLGDGFFPKHCVAGSEGAKFHPTVLAALNAKINRVHVFFKAFLEGVDSFGGVQYENSKKPLGRNLFDGFSECQLDGTGSFAFYRKPMDDLDSPPSNLPNACTKVRNVGRLEDHVGKELKNVFVCGLTLDYCVCDTMINLRKKCPGCTIYLIIDATRPVWIDVPGVGFLISPTELGEKLSAAGVRLCRL
jgi:nicotinamidase-related amidase